MINIYVKYEDGYVLAMRTANDLIAKNKIDRLKGEGNHKVKVLRHKPFIPVIYEKN